jgi:hypothetical protein
MLTPAQLYEELASLAMSVIKPPYFAERPVTSAEMSEIVYRVMRFAEKWEEENERSKGNAQEASQGQG